MVEVNDEATAVMSRLQLLETRSTGATTGVAQRFRARERQNTSRTSGLPRSGLGPERTPHSGGRTHFHKLVSRKASPNNFFVLCGVSFLCMYVAYSINGKYHFPAWTHNTLTHATSGHGSSHNLAMAHIMRGIDMSTRRADPFPVRDDCFGGTDYRASRHLFHVFTSQELPSVFQQRSSRQPFVR